MVPMELRLFANVRFKREILLVLLTRCTAYLSAPTHRIEQCIIGKHIELHLRFTLHIGAFHSAQYVLQPRLVHLVVYNLGGNTDIGQQARQIA
jgi:hypothetical protein